MIELVVERKGAELKANKNVGFPLTIEGHEDVEAVFVAVRAIQAQPPTGGLFAKLRGTAKGVLRLADLFEPKSESPLTAVATLMLYRANCRAVTGELPGAIGELKAAIEMMPGATSAERMPPVDTGEAKFNWQNHLAYLRLAELLDDDKERARVLGEAHARFEWLAMDELGATLRELSNLTEEMSEVSRGLYLGPGAPVSDAGTVRHPEHTTLSAVMAEASRHLRAGASLEEVRVAFGLTPDAAGKLPDGLAQKLSSLEAWETDQYMRALGAGVRPDRSMAPAHRAPPCRSQTNRPKAGSSRSS